MPANQNSNPEREIFEKALSLASADERAAFLRMACAVDSELLGRVESLLRAHEVDEGFLPEQPKVAVGLEPSGAILGVCEAPGDRIGRYKLREKIGEGGCGAVYVAEQEEPVRRRVALKVIKLGMDTRAVVARFEAERQALAMMDHPNIAKVLDAGATETGRPYFVMELVRGVKITDYCDHNKLSTRERLDLFIKVCQAVQHAHQKGIIHRDLKPSNILVTLHDGVPVPKVIDFGIAKATEGRLTDLTVYTELHQFLGTPAYMSPEQAELSGLDIDTRSDLYSLGVLLYELLIGKTPFDTQALATAGLDEMRRMIREQDPVRPSTRLGTMLEGELTTTAKQRSCDAPKLIHLLRGDLDWVVMKCLEKDRTRRYETANGLAMDVQRHLTNEAVVARPASKLYRFQKMVRRNKLEFTAAGALVALVVAVVLLIWPPVKAYFAKAAWERLVLQPAPWQEGDEMTLDLKVAGVVQGSDRFAVQAARLNGQKIWSLTHQAQTQAANAKTVVEAQAETFRPLHSSYQFPPSADASDVTYGLEHAEIRPPDKDEVRKIDLNGGTYDNEQFYQIVRRLPLAPGYKVTLMLLTPLPGQVMPFEIEVTGLEKVTVPAGTFECFKLKPFRGQAYWYSSDAHRYLVKYEAEPGGIKLVGELSAVRRLGVPEISEGRLQDGAEMTPEEAKAFAARLDKLNFGFEEVDATNQNATGWFDWANEGAHGTYSLSVDSAVHHGGRYSMKIQPGSNVTLGSFGCCACSIPAGFEGKQLELRGYLKLQNVEDGWAGLIMRIDGDAGVLKMDNMQKRNIHGTSDWKQYSIRLPLPRQAKEIFVGAILAGKGELWVDDLQLLVDGVDVSKAKTKKLKQNKAERGTEFDHESGVAIDSFSDEIVENLTVLGKVWGFLKYYHPKIAKGDSNWDYELFKVMAQVASAASSSERNSILSQWVNQLGPVNVSVAGRDPDDAAQAKMLPDLKWMEDKARLGEKLAAQLAQVRNAARTTTHYYIDLAPGVGNPIFKNEKGYNSMAYSDLGYRLLALYRYWNMIQYFYPYKYLIGEDWNSVLPEFVLKFINAKDELAYKLALLELIARVHDTHANISQRDEVLAAFKGTNRAALKVGIVQGKAVVTDYLNTELGEATGLKKGDIILSVDDKVIEAIIQERLPRTPASNHPTQLASIAADLLRSNDSSLMVSYEREGRTQSTSIKCVPDKVRISAKSQQRESCWELLTKEIGYLYPGSIRNADLPKIMLAFKNTKGIIIDLRCYPSEFIVFTLSEYLQPEGKDFVKFTAGSIRQPGLFRFTPNLKVGQKNPNYYKGKIVILVNETTMSQAEYTTMALRVAPHAVVLGSTTAAADGNVSEIILPGGIHTFITGIGVYYPDGTETQRVGIVPDIELKPTIKGIKDNRDELLERAKELINAAD